MSAGGTRNGAGRPKKSAAEKILTGNPGKRKIEIINFESGDELPGIPAKWLNDKAKEVYTSVYEWLKKVGCLKGILPAHLEEYAHCKSRWLDCEEQNTRVGLIVKDPSGKAVPSPFVLLSQTYMKQANDAWAKIYTVVRESKLQEWDSKSPNDDIMEKLLGGGGA